MTNINFQNCGRDLRPTSSPNRTHDWRDTRLQQFRQAPDETTDSFVTRCKNQASKCQFADVSESDERIIEQLIIGTRHVRVQEKLIEEGDGLTSLDAAVAIARNFEATQRQMKELHETQPQISVQAVGKSVRCSYCGRNHDKTNREMCPAFGKQCRNCGRANHWAEVCTRPKVSQLPGRSSSQTQQQPQRNSSYSSSKPSKQVSAVTEDFESLTFESISIHGVTDDDQARDQIFVCLGIDLPHCGSETFLRAKVDTGAQGNVLPLRIFKSMFPGDIDENGEPVTGSLQPSQTKLTAYGGSPLKQFGICALNCSYENQAEELTFYVSDAEGPAILGLPSLEKLKIIVLNCAISANAEPVIPIRDKDDLVQQYPSCFDGVGKFEGQYHITTDPDVPPVIHSSRRVPISLKDDIQKELDDMEAQGIIRPVRAGEPTKWVNSLVYRRKPNGNLRICLDPKDLNRAILRDHHVVPTLEEILPKLHGAKIFSILDAKSGYWNVELDEPSSYLTTFNSPLGRYRFLRMPFGLKMSQDVFQCKIDQLLEGCVGCTGIADDIVVYGGDEEEHDRNLHRFIKRCKERGLKLNPDKCQVKLSQIKFFGVICSKEGIQPDPKKVSAVKHMAAPQDKAELLSFLGLATYMGLFLNNLSTIAAPLRELTKKDAIFKWEPKHEEAFVTIKESIKEEVTLSYFDPQKPIVLQVDASMKGLGAALFQEGKPIAFASKALTPTESQYANIEREMLAVVFGCERFHTYLFGQQFIVESDHQPLSSIQLKHLNLAPSRLRRMLLRLQQYDFVIKYRPGKDVAVADALSRLSPEEKEAIADLEVQVHELHDQFSDHILERIKAETKADQELNALREVVFTGWPATIQEAPGLAKPYWNYRDEISIDDGLLLKGQRIIIPASMKSEILSKLHIAHQGMEKMKLRARSAVFWTGITRDIERLVQQCQHCQEVMPRQQREELHPSEIPPRAWHTIAADLFQLNGEEYLIIADYFSKYPFVYKMSSTESAIIVKYMRCLFSEQGIPVIVRSDNGPQFDSNCFRQFRAEYGFQHITSSPHYPRSNGFIESQVKLVKKSLAKAIKSQLDPYQALLCLRTTPIDHASKSPAELLFGRPLQDNLPRRISRQFQDDDHFHHLQHKQAQQKEHHDVLSRSLPNLVPGQVVTIQNPASQRWEPATVQSVREPRSAIVETPRGKTLRRNRVHIRSTHPPNSVPTSPVTPLISPSSPASEVPSAEKSTTSLEQERYVTRSGREVKPLSKLDL